MYSAKAGYRIPSDRNIKIWRYMDVTKFISMLKDRALFFSPPHRLGDPFEGSLGIADLPKIVDDEGKVLPVNDWGDLHQRIVSASNFLSYIWNSMSCTVNCWHMNEEESAAMWKIYSRSGEGIAVQSTFDRLRRSFNSSVDKDCDVHIGEVSYINHYDPLHGSVPDEPREAPLLHKRKSYEFEREIRAIRIQKTFSGQKIHFSFNSSQDVLGQELNLSDPKKLLKAFLRYMEAFERGEYEWLEEQSNPNETSEESFAKAILRGEVNANFGEFDPEDVRGTSVPVNLETLIEKVYVSPGSPEWTADLVTSLLEKYSVSIGPVIHSDLNGSAMY